ncbi:MAG: Holliday junction resolvase RuvX [Planctomycetaceae bacterium]|nr:Holliday junction resolvase RuvX [Planctomycetaceae bacterium]
MYWLGVDHGDVRIGLAGGDAGRGIASPLKVIPAQPPEAVAPAIIKLAQEYNAGGIVVGLPLNMDDSEGPQAKLARDFALMLQQATGLDVRLWDERLSSFAADKTLAGHMTRGKRRAIQDAIAAAEILQDFFACDGPDAAPRP